MARRKDHRRARAQASRKGRRGALADDIQNKTCWHLQSMTFDAVLIAGPTASGKSAAALALAEANGVVINADFMQVYARGAHPDGAAWRGRGAGAASTRAMSARDRVYSVGRTRRTAAALAEARAMGKLPIFAGGTGLYFTALTEGLAQCPAHPAGDPRPRLARLAGGDRCRGAALAARGGRSQNRVPGCGPAIHSASCAHMKCHNKKAVHRPNGSKVASLSRS